MFQLSFAASDTGGPLYDQLYRAIVAQIRHGELAPGERLPGKRSLAAELSVSVNTVDTAYQLLVAEGYLEAVSYTHLGPGDTFWPACGTLFSIHRRWRSSQRQGPRNNRVCLP